jgi:predicted dehydrogenase/nucleoside-diphosphate-sugar epimerase
MGSPNIALIGCGAAAMRYYVPALKKYRKRLGEIHCIDLERKNAQIVSEALGSGVIQSSYRDVLSEIDGAIILLPNHMHHGVAMECLNAGVHVLCEKPLAVSPDHAREMTETAEKNGLGLCVNNTRRMFPNFREVRKILHSGALGRPLEIEYVEGSTFGWQSTTGFYVDPRVSSKGILLDLGSHVVDTLCWWIGGKPDLLEVFDDSFGGPESVVKIKAVKDGCTIGLTLNRLCELKNTFRVICEKGSIEGKIFDWRGLSIKDSQGKGSDVKLDSPAKNYPGFVIPIVENFLDVMESGNAPLVSGREVLPSLEFIDECYGKRKRFVFSWDEGIELPRAGQPKRILVTGATGFVGGRIMEMLHLAGGDDLKGVAAIRQWSSAARLGRMPVDIVMVNLLDKGQVDRALEGITHVIHCAKGTYEATVEGTRNLLDAAQRKGVRHVIHMSTADVYGNATGIVDESFPLQYTGNAYNKMKIDAEKVCWEFVDKGLPITIFRPSIIYGPYSNSWCLRYASLMLSGEWGIFEKYGEGKCNLVYVDDLIKTILSSLDNNAAFGKAFNVNGPEIITWNEYFIRLNEALGLPPMKPIRSNQADMANMALKPVRIVGGVVKKHFLKPVKVIAENVFFLDMLMRRLEHQLKNKPVGDELKLYSKDVVYSNSNAEANLTYNTKTMSNAGISSSKEWLHYLEII